MILAGRELPKINGSSGGESVYFVILAINHMFLLHSIAVSRKHLIDSLV